MNMPDDDITWRDLGFVIGGMVLCMLLMFTCTDYLPDGSDRKKCSEACELWEHTEYAFDLQRGCVCSDPYPEPTEPTRAWTTPDEEVSRARQER